MRPGSQMLISIIAIIALLDAASSSSWEISDLDNPIVFPKHPELEGDPPIRSQPYAILSTGLYITKKEVYIPTKKQVYIPNVVSDDAITWAKEAVQTYSDDIPSSGPDITTESAESIPAANEPSCGPDIRRESAESFPAANESPSQQGDTEEEEPVPPCSRERPSDDLSVQSCSLDSIECSPSPVSLVDTDLCHTSSVQDDPEIVLNETQQPGLDYLPSLDRDVPPNSPAFFPEPSSQYGPSTEPTPQQVNPSPTRSVSPPQQANRSPAIEPIPEEDPDDELPELESAPLASRLPTTQSFPALPSASTEPAQQPVYRRDGPLARSRRSAANMGPPSFADWQRPVETGFPSRMPFAASSSSIAASGRPTTDYVRRTAPRAMSPPFDAPAYNGYRAQQNFHPPSDYYEQQPPLSASRREPVLPMRHSDMRRAMAMSRSRKVQAGDSYGSERFSASARYQPEQYDSVYRSGSQIDQESVQSSLYGGDRRNDHDYVYDVREARLVLEDGQVVPAFVHLPTGPGSRSARYTTPETGFTGLDPRYAGPRREQSAYELSGHLLSSNPSSLVPSESGQTSKRSKKNGVTKFFRKLTNKNYSSK